VRSESGDEGHTDLKEKVQVAGAHRPMNMALLRQDAASRPAAPDRNYKGVPLVTGALHKCTYGTKCWHRYRDADDPRVTRGSLCGRGHRDAEAAE
jgi:hypothetical protein